VPEALIEASTAELTRQFTYPPARCSTPAGFRQASCAGTRDVITRAVIDRGITTRRGHGQNVPEHFARVYRRYVRPRFEACPSELQAVADRLSRPRSTVRCLIRLTSRQPPSRAERRLGAQLLAGLASNLQSVLPTDRRISLNFYARLSYHDNARICRVRD